MIRVSSRLLAVGLALATSSACGHQTQSSSGDIAGDVTVTGTVTYRERVALPPDAVAEISLMDATIKDMKQIAEITVKSDREIKYFGALEGSSRYKIDGNELLIYGSERRPLRFSGATP